MGFSRRLAVVGRRIGEGCGGRGGELVRAGLAECGGHGGSKHVWAMCIKEGDHKYYPSQYST